MEPQNSSQFSFKKLALEVSILIVGIVIGAFASFYIYSSASYQAGFDAAKKIVAESQVGNMLRTPDDIRTISGTVTAINDSRITMHAQSTDPFEDVSLADRVVLVKDATKIVKISYKNVKVFQAEMDAFTKAVQTAESKGETFTASPPEPFTRTSVDIASVAIGDTISVTAEENVKTMKEFTASEIQIQSFGNN